MRFYRRNQDILYFPLGLDATRKKHIRDTTFAQRSHHTVSPICFIYFNDAIDWTQTNVATVVTIMTQRRKTALKGRRRQNTEDSDLLFRH